MESKSNSRPSLLTKGETYVFGWPQKDVVETLQTLLRNNDSLNWESLNDSLTRTDDHSVYLPESKLQPMMVSTTSRDRNVPGESFLRVYLVLRPDNDFLYSASHSIEPADCEDEEIRAKRSQISNELLAWILRDCSFDNLKEQNTLKKGDGLHRCVEFKRSGVPPSSWERDAMPELSKFLEGFGSVRVAVWVSFWPETSAEDDEESSEDEEASGVPPV